MKLLLVEDQAKFARTVIDEIGHLDSSIEITLVATRDEAVEALDSQSFDCVVCDLRIPAAGKSLSPAEDHGREVISHIQSRYGGTPVIVLSALADLAKCRDLQARGGNQDLFGNGSEYAMLYPLNKTELPAAMARVIDLAAELRIVEQVRLSFGGVQIPLEPWERRIIKTYARRRGAYEVRISRVRGGLSGSKTYAMRTVGTDLDINSSVLAKLGTIGNLADEKARYDSQVLPRLRQGHYAPLTSAVWAGAGGMAGLFYRLADGWDETLADVISTDPTRAARIVKRLAEIEGPWIHDAPSRQLTVGDIRRSLVPDDLAEKLLGTDLSERIAFERTSLVVRQACQHGDFHPLNVLVHGESALLVDFGNVGTAVASLDPIQLELALVFHPALVPVRKGWPTLRHAQAWEDLDEYVQDCPFADVVRECRTWAFQAGQSDFAVFANAYAYAIKQLKHGTTDRAISLAIARSAMHRFP